jgi:hypothetical protein
MRLNWLPGDKPRPRVVAEQSPVMATPAGCPFTVDAGAPELSVIQADCGSLPGTARTSAAVSSH